jgi:hypothetical protein
MTSERILNAVATYLRTKVTAEGGMLDLSDSVDSTLRLLGTSAGRFRVIVQWQREAPMGEARGGRTLTMLVIVQQGKDLSINPGDAVSVSRPASMLQTTLADSTTSSLNNAPLMQRNTQVRTWCRAIKFSNADIAQQWPAMQPGASYWLNDPNIPTRQIANEFTVAFGESAVTTESVTA